MLRGCGAEWQGMGLGSFRRLDLMIPKGLCQPKGSEGLCCAGGAGRGVQAGQRQGVPRTGGDKPTGRSR